MTASHAARANAYARAVVAGRIPASALTRLACERQLRDLARAKAKDPAFPYRWDPPSCNRYCRFAEMFPHIKGSWAARRERLRLEDWQCFAFGVPFGWLSRETGLRRFRTVYDEVPRKNAKTTGTAPVALYMLGPEREQGAEIAAAATKKDQARIVFDLARAMARKSPEYRTEFAVQVQAHKILCLETESVMQAIDSRAGTQDGANLQLAINDELHAWKGRELYGVLETAMGSRAQPLMWNITTAGADQSGVCYELRQYLEKVLRRVIDDETFFGIVYTIDEDDDIFEEATWRKANPNYGISVQPSDMRALAHKARNNPASRNEFKMKRLNVWVNAARAYFALDAWDACADPALRETDFGDFEAIVGADLASKRDVNAMIRWLDRGDELVMLSDFWLPWETVRSAGNASYRGWVDQGFIHATEGNIVDYQAMVDRVLDGYAVLHLLKEFAFDPFQAMHLVRLLMDAGVPCVEVRQTVLNLSEPMKYLDALTGRLAEGRPVKRFRHDGNPAMRWMLSNVTAELDRKDNVYPRKERPENKIDGPVAAMIGLARVLAAAPPAPSQPFIIAV